MQLLSSISALPMVLSIMVGVLLGLGGFTFSYAEGASYLSNDPAACVNCHVMRDQYDGWQKASHHQVATCNDCHIPHEFVPKYLAKMQNGFWHSTYFTLQNFHEPIQITPKNEAILENNCVGCHAKLVNDIAFHPSNDQQQLDCTKCHADVGHGPTGN
ncbi:MAG: Cytochrome c-type protein NrfH [Anaerolineae bacterium]|nr:Cytochrome c-type protein NrfH [Anaerolineae bacterium]